MGLAKDNRAVALGWQGHVSTGAHVDDFFHDDFTLAAWFMPRAVHGFEGPVFSDSGGGVGVDPGWFVVGQGDYRDGDGGHKLPGSPVLLVRAGNRADRYLLPGLEAGAWAHVAVVRHDDVLHLYVDGEHQVPVVAAAPVAMTSTPSSTIETWNAGGGHSASAAVADQPTRIALGGHDAYAEIKTAPGRSMADVVDISRSRTKASSATAWFADGTASSFIAGSGDLTTATKPFPYEVPPGLTPGDVAAIEFGDDDAVVAWYTDGTFSVGNKTDLDASSARKPFHLPDGRKASELVGVTLLPDGRAIAFYDDKAFSVGIPVNLGFLSGGGTYDGRVLFAHTAPMSLAGSLAQPPKGALRIGNRAPGFGAANATWQYHGLVDDVLLFGRAIGPSAIKALVAARRIQGNERGVHTGWTFDDTAPGRPGKAPFNGVHELHARAYSVPVSNDRDSSADVVHLVTNPFVLADMTKTATSLPFSVGSRWWVSQGYDAAGGSHNGMAAFSYDLVPEDPDAGEEVRAVADGEVVAYLADDGKGDGEVEANRVVMKIGTGLFVMYLHLARNSLGGDIMGGKPVPSGAGFPGWASTYPNTRVFDQGTGPRIARGELVGRVGPGANHLHLALQNTLTGPTTTLPMAFSDYRTAKALEELEPGKWKKVAFGIPLAEQYLLRTS